MKCTLLYKNCGYSTAALIKLCLNNKTTSITVRISFKLKNFCCKKNHLKQGIDTLLSMGRYWNKYSTSTPILRNKLILRKLLLNSVNISIWLIYLVNSYNNLYSSRLCMVNSLNSLWHNTIICSNNKYSYIS